MIDRDGVRYNATIVGADPFSDVAILKVGEKVSDLSENLAFDPTDITVSNDTFNGVVRTVRTKLSFYLLLMIIKIHVNAIIVVIDVLYKFMRDWMCEIS